MTQLLLDPSAWAALVTLIVLEVVLGIDNLVFVALLSNRLPEASRARTRNVGIALALVMRLLLLSAVVFIVRLTRPLFTAGGHAFSWRDLILLGGGLFLIWKAAGEIHDHVSPLPADQEGASSPGAKRLSVGMALAQIVVLDLVFSVDSILTAVGMTDRLPIMMAAVVVAVLLMMAASGPLAAFIRRNPSLVMLALAFLLMIGMTLIAEGWGFHVPKGYIYTAMAFGAAVEALNTAARRKRRRTRPDGAPPRPD